MVKFFLEMKKSNYSLIISLESVLELLYGFHIDKKVAHVGVSYNIPGFGVFEVQKQSILGELNTLLHVILSLLTDFTGYANKFVPSPIYLKIIDRDLLPTRLLGLRSRQFWKHFYPPT